jgi:membrane protein YqaA with SNARE-associated domain
LATLFELLGIVLTSFFLNIIPFAGPSNLFIASTFALRIDADPWTIGFLVAFGSASAKFIHYLATFFVGNFIGEERKKRLHATLLKLGRWSFLALFIVAASPLPDEPIVVPLGLMKYNPAKFYASYFAGKFCIGVIGAYFARFIESIVSPWISNDLLTIVSIVLTIVLTVVLFKVDIVEVARRILNRIRPAPTAQPEL